MLFGFHYCIARSNTTGQVGMPEEVAHLYQNSAEGVRQRHLNVEPRGEDESPADNDTNERQFESGSVMLSVRLVAMDSVQNVTVNERTTLLEIQRLAECIYRFILEVGIVSKLIQNT